jgi:hypothetical protein
LAVPRNQNAQYECGNGRNSDGGPRLISHALVGGARAACDAARDFLFERGNAVSSTLHTGRQFFRSGAGMLAGSTKSRPHYPLKLTDELLELLEC